MAPRGSRPVISCANLQCTVQTVFFGRRCPKCHRSLVVDEAVQWSEGQDLQQLPSDVDSQPQPPSQIPARQTYHQNYIQTPFSNPNGALNDAQTSDPRAQQQQPISRYYAAPQQPSPPRHLNQAIHPQRQPLIQQPTTREQRLLADHRAQASVLGLRRPALFADFEFQSDDPADEQPRKKRKRGGRRARHGKTQVRQDTPDLMQFKHEDTHQPLPYQPIAAPDTVFDFSAPYLQDQQPPQAGVSSQRTTRLQLLTAPPTQQQSPHRQPALAHQARSPHQIRDQTSQHPYPAQQTFEHQPRIVAQQPSIQDRPHRPQLPLPQPPRPRSDSVTQQPSSAQQPGIVQQQPSTRLPTPYSHSTPQQVLRRFQEPASRDAPIARIRNTRKHDGRR